MPNNIDERVVQMTFDNKQFERGVGESLKTLNDLKKALEFDKVEKSLSNIERAFNGVDLSGLSDSIDSIAEKFSPLGVIAVTTMQRITNAAIDAGKKVADAFLGFSDMSAGQDKYATRTKAVQTIVNATGKSVEEVEKVLEKLQDYTDETSYDFAEMVNSIGKFTSVGIELERAERAMEGIASEAAKSGAGKAEANRAMYNFAQALSQGAVKLQDWKSIENANMATKEFKETLIQTAIELGVLTDQGNNVGAIVTTNEEKLAKAEKQLAKAQQATKDRSNKIAEAQAKVAAATKTTTVNYQNFNTTLSDGWLTSDVLITTLEKYADRGTDFGKAAYYAAQKALTWGDAMDAVKDAVSSGWMETYQYLFGGLDEAIELWTNVSEALIDFTDIFTSWRNEVLKAWHEQGGYNDMIEAATNLWEAFMNIVKGVGKALSDVFPLLKPENATKALVDATKKIKDMSKNILEMFGLYEEVAEEEQEVTEEAEDLKESVEGVSGATQAVVQEMGALNQETQNVTKSLDGVKTGLKRGMRGESVKQMQKQLMKLGFRLDRFGADGIFGPETQAALKALQREIGVTETGVLDEATKAALKTEDALRKLQNRSKRGIGLGARGDEVKKLQKELNKYLSDSEKLAVDGIFGPKTEAALKKFQKESGVKQTGAWDEATKAADRYRKMSLLNVDKINKALRSSGDQRNGIKELQNQLIKTGYLTDQKVADGIYGPKTKEAVKQLQKDLGVEQTGKWDKATAKAARAASATGKTMTVELNKISKKITSSSVKSDIKKLQDELVKTGYLADKSLANGIFGPETETAIKNLQKDLGVKQTGIWDKATVIALHRSQEIVKAHTKVYKSSEKSASATKKVIDQNKDAAAKTSDTVNKTTLAMRKLQRIVRGWAAAIKIVTKFAGSIVEIFGNIAKMFNPLVKQIIDIAYLISGMIINLSKELEEKDVYKSFVDNVTKAFGPLGDFIKTIADGIHTFLKAYEIFLKKIDSKTPGEHNTFTNFLEFLKEYFKDNKIVNFVIGAFEAIKSVVGPIISFVIEKISDLIDWFSSDEFKQGKDNVLGWIAKQFEYIKTEIDKFRKAHPELTLENFGNKLREIGGWISDKVSAGIGFIVDKFTKLSEVVSEFVKAHPEFSISNILEKIVEFGKSIGETFKTLFAPGQQSESGNFFDEFKARLKAFEPVLQWFKDIKDKIVEIWNGIISIDSDENGEKKSFADILKDKLSGFEGIVDWFISIKDKIVQAWNELIGVGNGEELNPLNDSGITTVTDAISSVTKDSGFISVADKLKEFGRFLLDHWIEIAAAVVGISFVYGVINAIVVARNLSKGFAGLGDALKKKMGKDDDKDTIGNTALKIAASVLMVAGALKLLEQVDAKKAWEGFAPFVAILAAMTVAVIAINKLSDKDTDGGKQALMLAGSIGIIAASVWLLCYTISKYDNATVDLAMQIIMSMLISLGTIAILIGATSKGKGVELKGFLAMCAGVMVLALAFAKVVKILTGVKDTYTGMWAIAIIEAMLFTLGAIAVGIAESSDKGNANMKGFLAMCAGVYVLVLAFDKVIKILTNLKDSMTGVWAFAIIEAMVATLGLIAVAVAKEGKGGEAGLRGFIGMCAGVYVLALAFQRVVDVIVNGGASEDQLWDAFKIIEGMLITLGVISFVLSRSSNRGKVKIAGLIGLVAALCVVVELFARVVKIASQNNPAVINQAFWGIEILLWSLAAVAILMSNTTKGKGGLAGSIGNAITFVAMAFMMEKIVTAIGDTIVKIKNVNPEILKWFFIGLDAAVAVFATVVGVLGKLFAKNPAALFIGEAGLLGLLAVLAAGIEMVGGAVIDVVTGFSYALQTIGYNIQSFSNSISRVKFDLFQKLAKFAKEDLPEIIKGFMNTDIPQAKNNSDKLQYLGYNIKSFGRSIMTIGSRTLDSADKVKTLMNKTKEIVDALDLITFPSVLKQGAMTFFGGALELYGLELSHTDTTGSANVLQMIRDGLEIAEIVKNATWLDAAKTALMDLGGAIGIYYGELNKVEIDENGNAVEPKNLNVEGMASYLQELAKEFDDDTISQLTSFGEGKKNDMYQVALGLEALGEAIGSYADNIGKLSDKETEIASANSIIDKVKDIDEAYDEETLRTFYTAYSDEGLYSGCQIVATNIVTLGEAIGAYADNISEIDPKDVESANKVINKVMDIENWIDKKNEDSLKDSMQVLVDAIAMPENYTFDDFKGHVQALGEALGEYGNSISKLNILQIWKANEILKSILDLDRKLPVKPGFFTKFVADVETLQTFAGGMRSLGEAIVYYWYYIKDLSIDTSKSDDVAHVLDGIADIAVKLQKGGGFWSQLKFGTSSIKGLTDGLGQIGLDLIAFQTAVEDFDANKVEGALGTMEKLVGILSGVSFNELIRTDFSFGEYSKGSDISRSIEDLFSWITKLANDDSDSNEVNEALATIGQKIADKIGTSIATADTTGIKDGFTTAFENAIDTSFGTTVIDKVSEGIDTEENVKKLKDNITSVFEKALSLIDIMSYIDEGSKSSESGGDAIIDSFIGGVNLDEDAEQKIIKRVADVGKSIFGGGVAQAEEAMANESETITNTLGDKLKAIGENILVYIGAGISESGSELLSLGMKTTIESALTNFTENELPDILGDLTVENMSSNAGGNNPFANIIEKWASADTKEKLKGTVAEKFAIVGNEIVKFIAYGVSDTNGSAIITQLRNILGSVVPYYQGLYTGNPSNSLKGIGHEIITYIVNGINEKNDDIQTAITTALTEAYDGVKTSIGVKEESYSDKFKAIGAYIDAGLVKGLEEGSSDVTEMAKQVALAAYNAACTELGVESPSKKFMWIGEMVGEGFANGMQSYSKSIANTAAGISDSAVDSAKASAMKLYDAIGFGDGVDQPVIRPVLDLSNVKSGMGEINNMFGPRSLLATRSAGIASEIALSQHSNRSEKEKADDPVAKYLAENAKDVNDKFESMVKEIKGLKIFMDGNTLVGYVTPKVNRGLGQQAILANRLN